jgi:hypothetical protein
MCNSSIVGKDAQLAICNQYSDRELTRWKLVTKWLMFFPEGKPRVLKLRLKTLKIGKIRSTVPRLEEEISALNQPALTRILKTLEYWMGFDLLS